MDQLPLKHWILILQFILCCCLSLADGSAEDSKNLLRRLFWPKQRYNPSLIPLDEGNRSLPVFLQVELQEIIQLNHLHGRLHAHFNLHLSWQDCQLTWNPHSYGGQQHLILTGKDLWIPDIRLLNGVLTKRIPNQNARITHNGTVYYTASLASHVTCQYQFRFNQWVCPLEFGSWSYSVSELYLIVTNPELHTSKRIKQDWKTITKPATEAQHRIYNLHMNSLNGSGTQVWHYEVQIQKNASQKGPRYG